VTLHTYSPKKIKQCSEALAFKLQTLGNNPVESIRQNICCLFCILHFTVRAVLLSSYSLPHKNTLNFINTHTNALTVNVTGLRDGENRVHNGVLMVLNFG
jgi:hypothetical protein